jgi:2-polyprenyl-3-methyl-5-hydroxy-6-metoxy-1,4-benzoquinol methylase
MTETDKRAAAKSTAQQAIDTASAMHADGTITAEELQQRITDAVAASYLQIDDPRWQSGYDGDAGEWRDARAFILDAVPHDGSFLDIGCANGHLMESLVVWAAEREVQLVPYGLEINEALAQIARRRLPHWSEHIYTGNVMHWHAPRRFDFVRTGLEYVPPAEGSALISRLLREVVAPGGVLIVGPIRESEFSYTMAAFLASGVSAPQVASATDSKGITRYVVWATEGGLGQTAV